MALDILGIQDRLTSHALASGYFDSVNETKIDEPTGGGNITCGIWADDITPLRSSGLASTSVRIVFKVRLFTSTEASPESYVERVMVEAADALFSAYSGDFELGGEARNIDLLGIHGASLACNAHYMNLSGTIYRVMDLTVPILVNDVYDQSA
jgi:hypothetical protein